MQQFNPAKSTNYIFTIGEDRDLTFKLQNSSIGSINAGSTYFPTRYVDLQIPNDKLEFGPMSLRVLLSDELTEWFNLYKWMLECVTTNDAHTEKVRTAELTILNSENRPIMRFTYRGVHPLTLSDILYSVNDEEITLSLELSISYDSFDVENLITGERLEYGSD